MEYVYSAMLLHAAKKEITEDSVSKVLTSAGVKTDSSRVKALIASLEGVDIEDAISKAAFAPAPAGGSAPAAEAPSGDSGKKAKKKEEKEEEEEVSEESAAEGLSALFG